MSIPVIDLQGALAPGGGRTRDVAQELRAAAATSGFFYIVGHGVPQAEVDAQFALAQAFFALPPEVKARVMLGQSAGMRGWEAVGTQTLDSEARPDLKESYYCGPEHAPDHPYVRKGYSSYGANVWPAELPQMPAACIAYMGRMQSLAQRIMQLMAISLELEESFFDGTFGNPGMTLRMVRYPPHPADADEQTFGAGAHTDWGAVTILAQDMLGGLEVRMPHGEWVPARPIADSFVVNLGDMIPRWTNGRYRSNPHRVRNLHGGGQPRYSLPFFYSPDYEARVEPIASCIDPGAASRYTPCTVGEHMREMYRQSYGDLLLRTAGA